MSIYVDDPQEPDALAPVISITTGEVSPDFLVLDPDKPVWTIGRAAKNDLVLPADGVSRYHAQIERRDGAWWVCDLGSFNGTWIHDEQIQSARLARPRTMIRFSNAWVEFTSRELCRRSSDVRNLRGEIDPMTRALPRWKLLARLEQAQAEARATEAPLAVVFLDVDRLNVVNKFFGHKAGDIVLCTIAERLRARAITPDSLFRYAGDEFVLVLPGTELGRAEELARDLSAEIAAHPIDVDPNGGSPLDVAVWVGAALADASAATPLAPVDLAMSRVDEAKARRRARGGVIRTP